MADEEKQIRKINGYLLKDEVARESLATKSNINHNHDDMYIDRVEFEDNKNNTRIIINDYVQQLTRITNELNDKIDENEIQNNATYATKTFVTNKIAEAELEGTDIDLSGYATKDDLDNKADLIHNHEEYLTEHQDISHLASKEELDLKASIDHDHDVIYATKDDYNNTRSTLNEYVKQLLEITNEFNERINEQNTLILELENRIRTLEGRNNGAGT